MFGACFETGVILGSTSPDVNRMRDRINTIIHDLQDILLNLVNPVPNALTHCRRGSMLGT